MHEFQQIFFIFDILTCVLRGHKLTFSINKRLHNQFMRGREVGEIYRECL